MKDKEAMFPLGLWKCYAKDCWKQFTVRVGTVFESAHIFIDHGAPLDCTIAISIASW